MSTEIKIKLSQIYLELARCFISSSVSSRNLDELLLDANFIHDQSTFTFGVASVSTLYSYMAIESFINFGLFELWQNSRSFKKSIDEINKMYPHLQSVILMILVK